MSFCTTVDVVPCAAAPIVSMPHAEADSSGYVDGQWHVLTAGAGSSETGVAVNPMTALSHGPVWQGVNLLAGDLGQLPFHKMIRRGRNREKDREHPLEFILTMQPNEWQTPSMWIESMMAWALLWGNGTSYIDRDGRGQVQGLYPLLPDRTNYIKVDGQYWITTWINEEYYFLRPDETYRIPGLAMNGFWGQSFVDICRNVIGHGLALRKHGNATFKNGAVPPVALKHPKTLSAEARSQLRNEWNAVHGGVDNAGKVAILMEAMEIETLSVSNTDAQWLEAMKLDREQVASLLNLPAHMLNALENAAVRANLEEQTRGYFQRSLSRWMNKFAQEAQRKLLTERERRSTDPDHYFRWYPEAFLRGDIKTRYEAYQRAVGSRILSPNECREMEDLNPYDGGDEYANPAIDVLSAGGEEGGGESSEAGEDDHLQPGEDPQTQALQNLIRVQCDSLVAFESHKLAWARKNDKNLAAWAADFYRKTFLDAARQRLEAAGALAFVLHHAGDWETAVQSHAEKSIELLTAAADLGEPFEQALPERASLMARAILGAPDGC